MENKRQVEERVMNEVKAVLEVVKKEKEKQGLSFEDEFDLWAAFPKEESYLRGMLEVIRYCDVGLWLDTDEYIQKEVGKLVGQLIDLQACTHQWLVGTYI